MKTRNILSILAVFLILSSIASAVEIRGTVAQGAGTYTWTAQNFAGFYYDIDENLASETMSINSMNGRNIPVDELVYTTQPISVEFEYSKEKNLPIYGSVRGYKMVGWQAENWVALNNKSNKLVKLVKEMKGSDKATITSGGSLSLGNGYVMKMTAIDAKASPRQAWVSITKDGTVIDEAILQQDAVYNLRKNTGGETDALILSAYVSSIFSGTDTDMIQLQYLWFIDESTLTEVKTGDKFGVFEVTSVSPVTLTNPSSISLDSDTVISLMGNMKFRVADDANNIRFYPFVNVGENIVTPVITPVITVTPIPTPISTVTKETVYRDVPPTKESCKTFIDEAIASITPSPTLVPTEVATAVPIAPVAPKPSPAFESIFAIAGLLAVAFLVLRQRK